MALRSRWKQQQIPKKKSPTTKKKRRTKRDRKRTFSTKKSLWTGKNDPRCYAVKHLGFSPKKISTHGGDYDVTLPPRSPHALVAVVMVAGGHHCHGLGRLYEVLGASRSAPLVAREPVVATVVLHVGGGVGELVAMHLLLVARVIVPPSLLLLLGSSDLVVALLAVESGK